MSSKNFYGLTGDVTVDGGILNVGNAQLYANTETSNVGIGTTNAEFKLDVHGDANVENLYATYLHGDGSNIENIVSSQWEGSPGDPIYYTSNVGIANTSPVTKTLQVGSNLYVEDAGSNVIHVTGNVYADYFVGDGSQLTGIAASLDQIVDQGNTVSNTIQLVSGQDATSNVGLVTHEGVSISVSNANPTGEYQFGVGSNLLVNVYSSNVLTVGGNVFAQKMTLGSVTVTPAYNLQQITETGPTTNQTLVLSNVTTGLTADANVVVNGNVTAGSVITSGNVNAGNVITSSNIEVGGDLSVTGNVYIDDMRVAEVASNLVTYDSTTGELMDSGGLFSNKLAVVSEQPPIALTGASTVVTNHGTYTIEASSGTVVNLFDKNDSTKWVTDGNYSTTVDTKGTYGGSASLAGHGGEWVKITMPYKTILRHIKIESTNQSVEDIELVGLNADGLTWTPLKTETGLTGPTHTIIVNATTHHRTYGLIVEKTNTTTGRSAVEIEDLKLFTESFSIDGGKVEMASSAVMGGETTMDQHGPHGRGEAKLKKYPEIVFEDGKIDRNDTTNTYTQAGYTVSTDSVYQDRQVYRAFSTEGGKLTTSTHNWSSEDVSGNGYIQATGEPVSGVTFQDENSTSYTGHYIKLELPKKIKLNSISFKSQKSGSNNDKRPTSGTFLGSTDGTNWVLLKTFNEGALVWSGGLVSTNEYLYHTTLNNIVNDGYFSYIIFLIETVGNSNAYGVAEVRDLKYYGYEELATQGDTSVDTTFTSIMNTPQTTGANVYIDGNLGETLTNRVTGPDATGPSATYDATGKYWELNGTLTSNIAVEANTFLEGDQPHSVSVWFNSSNLEANVSNTCVFSISDQEKLDSVNLDLQSNTWHNLTYAYQGEGGSRVTYLDGRKVAEDQAEDTFGDYPPFAMTGYSQGGYVVSASNELSSNYPVWKAFDDSLAASYDTWVTGSFYSGGTPSTHDGSETTTYNGTSTVNGEWIQLELPHKIKLSYYSLKPQIEGANDIYNERMPGTGKILGSNDGINWYLIHDHSLALSDYTRGSYTNVSINTSTNTKAYKYIRFVIETTAGTETITGIGDMKLYGHRENDLVRLPDPTNVLKYPHIAMTGPAQRGYVASSQHSFDTTRVPFKAFSELPVGNLGNGWSTMSNTFDVNGNAVDAGVGTRGTFGSYTGHWIKLELPHKLKLENIYIGSRDMDNTDKRQPVEGAFFGSNNDSTWDLLHAFSSSSNPLSFTDLPGSSVWNFAEVNTLSESNTNYYKYIVLVVTKINASTQFKVLQIQDLKFYGTEENSSIPIQIGGGNIDKVANFRVYDKFVGEDQALEIWDAQKDAFGRAKSSMTLQKGRLGIGTTEPEGRLAVADEPHNLEEFPPRAMTGYKTYFEGHGEFCASASHEYTNTPRLTWKAFNKSSENIEDGWMHGVVGYTGASSGTAAGNTPTYNGSASLGGIGGDWISLEFPYKVKLNGFKITSHFDGTFRGLNDGFLLGRNDKNSEWTRVHEITNLYAVYGVRDAPQLSAEISFINDTYYNEYALIATSTTGHTVWSAIELRYFGTREQGQSVLHDGQLTLTKSLTVPRIGPALDADDTPRRDRLVVEYNTSTNPTFEGAVRDTSGRGNDGVFYGGASYDATEKALVFDGTDDYITTRIHNQPGDWIHSISFWVKFTSLTGSTEAPFQIGPGTGAAASKYSALDWSSAGLNWYFFSNDLDTTYAVGTGGSKWIHFACVYEGGGATSSRHIYIDGINISSYHSSSPSNPLDFNSNQVLTLGRDSDRASTDPSYFHGKISNFKLYDTALTVEEVKTLYDMGRCDEGHHVVNFSKTRVGIGLGDGEVPRVALDVRGDIVSSGIIGPQARASATTFYNLGYRGTGFYPIRGRAPTSGGLGPEGDIYNIYCNMDPNWYGGKWMCFARLNQDQNFDQQNIFTRSVVGDPSNLGSSFTVPIGIMAPDNEGYDLEVMLTVHGGGGSSSVGPWRSDFGGRVGGIWTGISLNNAFDETRGDDNDGPNTSNPRVSDDGINYTSITGTFIASAGWAFSISTSGSGDGSYLASNKGTSGWILHENNNNGYTYSIYARVYAPNDSGSSDGETIGNYSDWDYVHVWIRAPE
jgi:cytoskeletal protein CcmA (bactofilin family)